MSRLRLWLPLAVCATALAMVAAMPAQAQQAAARKQAAPTPSQAMAREVLMRMAAYLGGAKGYSVSLRAGYDSVQASGQKIEFNETRKVVLSRPDRLRVEGERSDGAKTLLVFDGKEITLVDEAHKVYAVGPQPGSVDRSVVHFVSDLGMRLPLAVLLLTRMPAEFEARVQSVDIVEKAAVFGKPTYHLAARTSDVDFQVWVTEGDQPLPQRVVITYKKAPGQPQFWAQFSDWNLSPAVNDATFAAKIPAGAQKVAFAAQLQGTAMAGRKAPAAKGAKK